MYITAYMVMLIRKDKLVIRMLLLKKKNKTETINSIQLVYYYQKSEVHCYYCSTLFHKNTTNLAPCVLLYFCG